MSGWIGKVAAAALTGTAMWAIFLWKLVPYAIRERHPALLPWWMMPLLAFLAAFLLSLGGDQHRLLIPAALVAGMVIPHIILIVVDCAQDPTNHNLWPFEFVFILVEMSPALLGPALARRLQRKP